MNVRERSRPRLPTRREILALGAGTFVIAALPLARRRAPRLVRRTVPLMGTLAEIAVVHRDEAFAQAAIDAAFDELRRVEQLMTRFSPDSDVGRANRLAATDGVAVDVATGCVLSEALAWAETSDGAFDPCLGRAAELWDVEHRTEPPGDGAVRRFAHRRLYRVLDLDLRAGGATVRLTDADAAIDLGGIGKGYGVDRAVAVLREWNVAQGLVNVGGDLYALGNSEDGDPWSVGIRAPEDPRRLAGHFPLSDGAVATSGDYLRHFQYGGRRYHHLLDPATGEPRQTATHSVTVAAGTCLAADAAATTVFGMAPDAAPGVLRRRAPGAEVVHMA